MWLRLLDIFIKFEIKILALGLDKRVGFLEKVKFLATNTTAFIA